MTPEPEKAEFAEFEIVPGPETIARTVSPWAAVRLVLLGLFVLGLFMILLTLGLILLAPVVIFLVITRIIASLMSSGPRR